ncbi:MAG: PEP-CTERM sorting domain-containing protein [Armatimonadetes bacterium]|nr:PEP-CTERM sorting domain-containing protein [Armatimonadota bacterium]
MKRVSLVLVSLVFAVTSALATVIDTYPYWDGGITSGWTTVGQSFDAAGSVMTDYQFAIEGGSGSLTVEVYNWTAGLGPTGAALYSTVVAWPTTTGDVVLSGINVAMTMGGHYGVVVDGVGPSSVHWMGNTLGNPTGDGYWGYGIGGLSIFDGLSTQFKATFDVVPEPASIAALGLGLVAVMRRRAKK